MTKKVHTNNTSRAWNSGWMTSEHVKATVDNWAWRQGMWSIEEIGNIVDGRLDLLLVPVNMESPIFKANKGHWTERLGLVGVEVKVERSDFVHGINSGQFARYQNSLSGLYVAGPPDVVRLKEVPADCGVIHVAQTLLNEERTVCRRHPRWKRLPLTEESAWRIVWAFWKQMEKDFRKRSTEQETLERKIRDHAGRAICAAINELRK